VTPPPLVTTISAAPTNAISSNALSNTAASSSAAIDSSAPSPTSAADPGSANELAVPAPLGDLTITTVTTGLDVPWGLGFLPDGTAVVTGRNDASVSTIAPDGTVTAVGTIIGVEPAGEGGLLGVAVSPNFAQDNLLYVYYSGSDDNRIDTVTLRDGQIGNQTTGLTGIPRGNIHNGGRLAFGPDGMLYVGTGETGQRTPAQDPNSLGGKILRVTPEFAEAPGNPGDGLVYSTGHRNVQGLAFDDEGHLWASEFGQNTWDELNLIVAGGNYGWPEVEGQGPRAGFIDPLRVWPTSEASPSGVAFWKGSIWMAGLRGERLWQIPIVQSDAGPTTGAPVAHLTNVYGRLRTVAAAPDGSLWVMTSNTDGRGDIRDGDDRILRIQA
jgi:glucose/arabinose dehydrogenase